MDEEEDDEEEDEDAEEEGAEGADDEARAAGGRVAIRLMLNCKAKQARSTQWGRQAPN